MIEYFDISRAIAPGAVVYPGDPAIRMETVCPGLTALHWSTHTLTHIDPPAHFIPGGASIDQIPLTRFHGPALVVAVAGPVVLAEHVVPAQNLLFKTQSGWSDTRYLEDHVYISLEAAEKLAQLGVNLVGIDYLSVDRHGDPAFPAHHTLLRAGVLILEGVDLSAVEPGLYTLLAMPLKIANGDGSPVRAVLYR